MTTPSFLSSLQVRVLLLDCRNHKVELTGDDEVEGQADLGLGVDLAEVDARVRRPHVVDPQAPRVRPVCRLHLDPPVVGELGPPRGDDLRVGRA